MTQTFFRSAAAAAALALVVGVSAPSAFAESTTLGETGYLNYGVTNGDDTKTTNQTDRYLRGSGASSGPSVTRQDTANASTPKTNVDEGRYLRGSGISSGPVQIRK